MKIPRVPHRWVMRPGEAIQVQRRLAGQVRLVPPEGPLRLVAGLDAAFFADGRQCLAAAVLWDRQEHRVVEIQTAAKPVHFPYIPGLLSFREAPALLAALRRLCQLPDLLLCDGQGLAHPRRFGIACHMGVICDLPAIGCAKSLLVGTHQAPGFHRGACEPLFHHAEIVGAVLRTRDGVRPVYVSVGHRMDLAGAVQIVLASAICYRLPEPTRLADRWVAQLGRIHAVHGHGSSESFRLARTARENACRSDRKAGCR